MSNGWVASIDEIVEDYGKALKRAAHANAVEASAEDQRKITLAEQIVAQGDMAVTKAENIARAGQAYRAAIKDCFEARKEAEDARAEAEHIKTRWETWRTKTSAQKARLQHG